MPSFNSLKVCITYVSLLYIRFVHFFQHLGIKKAYKGNLAQALLHVFPDIGLDPVQLYASWSSKQSIFYFEIIPYSILASIWKNQSTHDEVLNMAVRQNNHTVQIVL